jgi:competence protein ComGF
MLVRSTKGFTLIAVLYNTVHVTNRSFQITLLFEARNKIESSVATLQKTTCVPVGEIIG